MRVTKSVSCFVSVAVDVFVSLINCGINCRVFFYSVNVRLRQLFTFYRLGNKLTSQAALDIRALCAMIADLEIQLTLNVLTAAFAQLDTTAIFVAVMVLVLSVRQVLYGCYQL